MKKQYFLIIDTETTINNTVADFGAVVVDRKGLIFAECGVLVAGEFGEKDLFYDVNSKMPIWQLSGLKRRTENYHKMLESGSRVLASVNAINRWLDKVKTAFNPTLTAYNLAFDIDKMKNTGIDHSMFSDRFCLWGASVGNICKMRKYKNFVLDNHIFNNRTDRGNHTFSTSAETVYQFLTGDFTPEPHTGLEDAKLYELPILLNVIKKKKWHDNIVAYNWRSFQTKDHFKAK